jgi:hypothetical protein
MSFAVSTPVPRAFFRLLDAAEVAKRRVDPVNWIVSSFGNLRFAARASPPDAGVVKEAQRTDGFHGKE